MVITVDKTVIMLDGYFVLYISSMYASRNTEICGYTTFVRPIRMSETSMNE